MAVAIQPLGSAGVEVTALGKLTTGDYRQFRELVDERIEREGNVNLLVVVKDFSGWTPGAFWEDLKFDVAHYNDVARLALVGSDPSQHWMATVSKPLTSAEVKYYSFDDIDAARKWVGQSAEAADRRTA